MIRSHSDSHFQASTRNEMMDDAIDWSKLEKTSNKGMKKWLGYAAAPRGHFPHPTNPDKLGLPWYETDDNPALPSDFIKPCVNTAPSQYNFLRKGADVMETQQAEMCESVRRELKHSFNANNLLDPTGNSFSRRYHIYGSTKSLGRLYFDHKNHPPLIKLKQSEVDKILPPGYSRKRYDFWR